MHIFLREGLTKLPASGFLNEKEVAASTMASDKVIYL